MYFALIVASCSATPNAFPNVLYFSCLQAGFSSVTKGVVPWGPNLMFSFSMKAFTASCSAKPWITVGAHGFGCWAPVQLSLLSDSNSCSTSAELCITVGRGEDETGVVISQPDHFHKLRSIQLSDKQQTILLLRKGKSKKSVGFLGQNGGL